jgi:hypothetical protein
MKTVAIALFIACVVGSSLGLDCSTKFKDFHTCVASSHKKAQEANKAKFEALKAKLDACYTDNGCTPPARPQKVKGGSSGASSGESSASTSASGERRGNHTEGRECRKAVREALKGKFEQCIKQSIPDFTFPPKDAQHDKPHFGGQKGFNHKDENKNLDGCAKKQAVRDCKRALLNSSRPTEDEKRAHFKANCDAKQACQASLGAECQAQLEKFKKAACECRQQQHQQIDQIRSGVKACENVPERKGKRPQNEQKQKSCEDHKDYCKLGYDAFVADHQKGKGQGRGGAQGKRAGQARGAAHQ